MKALIAAAALTIALTGPAAAFQCPTDMAKIDAALQSQSATLSDADKAKVAELRAEGERLHRSGQHQQSVDTLAKAKEILGIK